MRALLSVANRDEITGLARDLLDLGVEIFATDGTREHLAGEGVQVGSVTELTDVPPLVGGQVKTFHPAVYAGILARRDVAEQLDELEANEIGLIDIVVVNVAPFAPAVGARLVGIDEAIEMIDVGGAALLGAAARNAAGVAAVSSPAHYAQLVAEIRERGLVSAELRARLAAEAYGTVAAYYAEIAAYLNQISGNMFPDRLALVLEKVDDLRYGENPHQHAAFYRETTHRSGTLADATQIRGARPSFNNLLDLDAAYRIAMRLHRADGRDRQAHRPRRARLGRRARRGLPARARDRLRRGVRRHRRRQPRARRADGPGDRGELVRGGRRARATTRRRSASSRPRAASRSSRCRRTRRRGCATTASRTSTSSGSRGGLLVESLDDLGLDRGRLQVVTRRRPTLDELNDLLFAWRAVRHVRSNAIVLARNGATVGIGAAQASRQVSVEIALRRAGDRAKTAVMASDAYFPFPDGIQMAAQAGITAIVQPGGSIRDEMAIEVADRHHMAMVFTGKRHFRH